MKCPISDNESSKLLEVISAKELVHLYNRLYKNDISYLFEGIESITMYQSLDTDIIWFDPLISGDERFYNALQRYDWYYSDEKNEFNIAKRFISSSDRILEVGCGKGNFAKLVDLNNYTGLEFSLEAVALAEANGVKVFPQSIQDHALDNQDHYDIVCAFQVLEHVTNIKEFISSMIHVLKPGGKLIIAVPSQDSYLAYSNNLALNLPPHHISRYTDKSLKSFEQYFPVKLMEIIHDPLQEKHYSDYVNQKVIRKINSLFGVPYKSVNNSMLNFLFRIPAKLISLALPVLIDKKNLPIGHTVTAIYKKIN